MAGAGAMEESSSSISVAVVLVWRQLMSGNNNNPAAVAVVVAVVTVVVVLLRHQLQVHQGRRLPPAPRWRLPVIGHLHLLRPPVHRSLHELSSRTGPLMHIRLGSTHCVVAGTAEAACELIRGHEGSISERPVTAVARQFAYGASGFAFAPYDAHWRFMKRLCMSELLGPRTVEQLRPVRRAGAVALVRAALAAAESGEAVVDLTRELIRMANTSVLRMVASAVPGSVADEAQGLVKDVAELVGAFNVEDYIAVCRGWDVQGLQRRAVDVHRRFDKLLEEILTQKEDAREARKALLLVVGEGDRHERTPPHKDLLDILMDKAEDEAAEVKLTRDNIKAFIIDVVTAGSDTSAAMVEWMLAELLNHPECLRKVVSELDAVVGRDRIAGEADLPRLPYLAAAYKETLRLHPAAPIAHRQASEEMSLVRGGGGSFTVPAGAAVFINVWGVGRDPACWDAPLEFRPERFLPGGAAEGVEPRGQHFQFMPFGSGRRGCPGMGLAMQSVPAVLAALVQCFQWDTIDDTGAGNNGNKIDMSESEGLVCARMHPLLLRPTPRLNPFPPVL